MSLKQQPMKEAPLGLSRFSVSQHGRTWRSCRFPVSRFSGSDCSCPVRGQCLIYKEYQGSLNSTFFCASQTQHFISKITGFVLSCLESYRHFVVLSSSETSELTLLYVLRNVAVCHYKRGCLSLGAAAVKDAIVFPDPTSVSSPPGGKIFFSSSI